MSSLRLKFLLILIVVTFLISPVITELEIVVGEESFSPLSYPTEDSKIVEDKESKIYARVPKEWNVTIGFENLGNKEGIIKRRLILESGKDRIFIDIFPGNKSNLEDNYNKLEGIFLRNTDKNPRNGKINGLDAVLSSDLDSKEGNLQHLSTFFQTTEYIYRIIYPIVSDEGVEKYLGFVNNFKLKDRQNIEENSLKEFPLPRKRKILSFRFINIVNAVNTCGAYTMVGNNFPCCASGGNCTWWAIYKRQDLKNKIVMGDAGQDWIDQAQQAGLSVSQNPTPGSIVVWGPNDVRTGHVAYVNSVTNNDLFNISEMNCAGAIPGPRDLNAKKVYSDYWVLTFLGFIGGESTGELIIQNQTINTGIYSSSTQVRVLPATVLNPSAGDIILKIQ